MSNVIGFLERMGQDAKLRNANRLELQQVLTDSGLDAKTQAAILRSDGRQLEALLSAKGNVCAIIYFGEEEGEGDPPAQ